PAMSACSFLLLSPRTLCFPSCRARSPGSLSLLLSCVSLRDIVSCLPQTRNWPAFRDERSRFVSELDVLRRFLIALKQVGYYSALCSLCSPLLFLLSRCPSERE